MHVCLKCGVELFYTYNEVCMETDVREVCKVAKEISHLALGGSVADISPYDDR